MADNFLDRLKSNKLAMAAMVAVGLSTTASHEARANGGMDGVEEPEEKPKKPKKSEDSDKAPAEKDKEKEKPKEKAKEKEAETSDASLDEVREKVITRLKEFKGLDAEEAKAKLKEDGYEQPLGDYAAQIPGDAYHHAGLLDKLVNRPVELHTEFLKAGAFTGRDALLKHPENHIPEEGDTLIFQNHAAPIIKVVKDDDVIKVTFMNGAGEGGGVTLTTREWPTAEDNEKHPGKFGNWKEERSESPYPGPLAGLGSTKGLYKATHKEKEEKSKVQDAPVMEGRSHSAGSEIEVRGTPETPAREL